MQIAKDIRTFLNKFLNTMLIVLQRKLIQILHGKSYQLCLTRL